MTQRPIPIPPTPPPIDDPVLSQWALHLYTWADGVHRALLNLRSVVNAAVIKDEDGNYVLSGDICHTGTKLGFYSADKVVKPTISGSRDGNAALASILSQLDGMGLVDDQTTAS